MENKHLIFESKEDAEKVVPVNAIRKIKIDEKLFGLANTPRGFKVFDRSCPHAGADLSTGRINYLGELVCPLHAYTFSFLDGGEERDRCPPIRTYDTVWEEGKLYVIID
ncbi:MAG: Rieske 2Fe-2S domain-containing protein [Cyclobacteriaceae bacterium]